MGKLNKDNKGFGAIELLIVIVVVVILCLAGWMVYKDHHKAPTVTTTSKTTISYTGWKTYTPADKVYTISYPANWVGGSCANSNSCHTDAYTFDNEFSTPGSLYGPDMIVLHTNSSQSPKAWVDQYQYGPIDVSNSCLYDANSNTVNGYQAYFFEQINKPYTSSCPSTLGSSSIHDDFYIVADNNQVVLFDMTVGGGSHYNNGGSDNTILFVPIFKEIVQSIKFNN